MRQSKADLDSGTYIKRLLATKQHARTTDVLYPPVVPVTLLPYPISNGDLNREALGSERTDRQTISAISCHDSPRAREILVVLDHMPIKTSEREAF